MNEVRKKIGDMLIEVYEKEIKGKDVLLDSFELGVIDFLFYVRLEVLERKKGMKFIG